MSWISMLLQTYDNCIGFMNDCDGIVLAPLFHKKETANIIVKLDLHGKFKDAELLEHGKIIYVPSTKKSETGRTSGLAPYALYDKLQYVAGDLCDYLTKKEKNKYSYVDYFNSYIDQLKEWCSDENCPEEVVAIKNYLCERCLISDLVSKTSIFAQYCMKENSKWQLKNKILNKDTQSLLVCFDVTDTESFEVHHALYQRNDVRNAWTEYYSKLLKTDVGSAKDFQADIDYATGESAIIANKHPSSIRKSGDNAKIISSNDEKNFTFLGRFSDHSQAASLGYISSLKVHNTLSWLISTQGYKIDSECIVCWATSGENIPSPTDDTFRIIENGLPDFSEFDETDGSLDTDYIFAQKLNKAMAGYKQKLDKFNKNIIVMCLDTADGKFQGRLAITYYIEQEPERFLSNILKWHNECSWRHEKKEKIYYTGVPSPKEIILTAYGTERRTGSESEVYMKPKYLKKGIDRILPCIVEGRKIPKDIVYAAVRNVGNPQNFKCSWNMLLENACSMIVKYQHDYGKEVFKVALDKNSMDRDYLFGRLLAAAHQLEDYVNFKSGNKGRETNAMKYWSVYAQKPARTYNIIRQRLQPYISKLNSGSRNYYISLAEEIFDKLAQTGSFNNEPLKENYLLGYYSQSMEFRKNNTNEEENEK